MNAPPWFAELEMQRRVAEWLLMNWPPLHQGTHKVVWSAIDHSSVGAREGARKKALGVRAGLPDLMFVYQDRAHWIELKTRDGALSPDQKFMRDAIQGAGGMWARCRSEAEVIQTLLDWGFPVRKQQSISEILKKATGNE